jgi:glycerol kinase
MKSAYYVASVQYDTDDGETADQYAYGTKIEYLVENIKNLISRRKNGELLFASLVDRNEQEHNITEKVRSLCCKE